MRSKHSSIPLKKNIRMESQYNKSNKKKLYYHQEQPSIFQTSSVSMDTPSSTIYPSVMPMLSERRESTSNSDHYTQLKGLFQHPSIMNSSNSTTMPYSNYRHPHPWLDDRSKLTASLLVSPVPSKLNVISTSRTNIGTTISLADAARAAATELSAKLQAASLFTAESSTTTTCPSTRTTTSTANHDTTCINTNSMSNNRNNPPLIFGSTSTTNHQSHYQQQQQQQSKNPHSLDLIFSTSSRNNNNDTNGFLSTNMSNTTSSSGGGSKTKSVPYPCTRSDSESALPRFHLGTTTTTSSPLVPGYKKNKMWTHYHRHDHGTMYDHTNNHRSRRRYGRTTSRRSAQGYEAVGDNSNAVFFFHSVQEYCVSVDIPGAAISNTKVTYHKGLLSIQAERTSGCNDNTNSNHVVRTYEHEFVFGDDQLVNTHSMKATSMDGVLTVTATKKNPITPMNIPIMADNPPNEVHPSCEIRMEMDIPGIKMDDLKLCIDTGVLSITGQRYQRGESIVKVDKKIPVYAHTVDLKQFQAFLKNGVLTIVTTRHLDPCTQLNIVVTDGKDPFENISNQHPSNTTENVPVDIYERYQVK